MYKINVNNKHNFSLESSSQKKEGKINGIKEAWDLVELKNGNFHILMNNRSFTAAIIKADYAEKNFIIKINNSNYTVQVKDKFDELLKTLGMDNLNSSKVNEIKAPMPGLVLDVRVSEDSVVKKGDAVVVLEAMKMENMLKSPADGIVKKINVKKGTAVEKNQVLIVFQ
ncbi:MAG: acetyl-CoA carboxylase biotin carboxyl carrier protein subunit [Bacteroidia bacterium]|nr:acetyl-CoA carboxylase biotin carboxyl carrier protein subunit [Bacteroidia bacterium]